MERCQFWRCQHTSSLSNPSCQEGLSGGGEEVGGKERSSGAIPWHQVFTYPSWPGYEMRALWPPKSLKDLTYSAPKLCHLLSQCLTCMTEASSHQDPLLLLSWLLCAPRLWVLMVLRPWSYGSSGGSSRVLLASRFAEIAWSLRLDYSSPFLLVKNKIHLMHTYTQFMQKLQKITLSIIPCDTLWNFPFLVLLF